MTVRGLWNALGVTCVGLTVACTSLQRNYGPPPGTIPGTPVPSGVITNPPPTGPTPSSVPTSCATQDPNAATIVAMVSFVTATPDPTYGVINGYAILTGGAVPPNAMPIHVSTGSTLQFQNGESVSTPPVLHSAIDFPSVSAFPPVPFSFPATTASALGTTISNAQWSTGRIQPGCFSQTFTASTAGTYYFGDYDYYNTSNTRDVIVVGP